MSVNAFEIKDLVKIYKNSTTPANDSISLNIRQGEVFGLLGPNGAGKSTFVRQLAGMIRPTSGSIKLYDHDLLQDAEKVNNWVSLQPQNIWLPAQTKPREIMEITGRLRGLSPQQSKRDAEELIEEFKLSPHLGKKMQVLSGGLRRLVAIAVTLIGNRPVVILDEPTNDLDPEIRRTIWKRIQNTSNSGRTVILVTHNVLEAESTLDRVAIMQSGKIIALGTPDELKARVSQMVRLEVVVRPETEQQITVLLSEFAKVLPTGQNRLSISVPQERVENAITKLLPNLNAVQDFRIISSNLEEVYFELSGGDSIAG